MTVLVQWILRFAAPALGAVLVQRKERSLIKQVLYIHVLVAFSVLLLHLYDVQLTWSLTPLYLGLWGVSVMGAVLLLRLEGLLYALSSALQETCILLSAVLLLPEYNFSIAAILTGLLFMAAHHFNRHEVYWKMPLLFVWIVISVYLYIWLEAPLLNIAIHTMVGVLLIKSHLLLKETTGK